MPRRATTINDNTSGQPTYPSGTGNPPFTYLNLPAVANGSSGAPTLFRNAGVSRKSTPARHPDWLRRPSEPLMEPADIEPLHDLGQRAIAEQNHRQPGEI